MDAKLYVALAVVLGIVGIVFLLRDRIFSLKGTKGGFDPRAAPPEQKPGVVAEGLKARTGSALIENQAGTGVEARDVEAGKDIRVTNSPPPKP